MKALFLSVLLFGTACSNSGAQDSAPELAAPAAEKAARLPGTPPVPFRGLHLTAWVAGAPEARGRFLDKIKDTAVNAVVVPIKEADGQVYVPGLPRALEYGTQKIAIRKPEDLVADLRRRGLWSVARIVVFKDDVLPLKRPDWAIKDRDGGLWTTGKRKRAWVDPYRKELWDYNIELAEHAAALGFDEVQFDYIRFPSDGDTGRCRYSYAQHTSTSAMAAMDEFLGYARKRLSDDGVVVSIAVFGLIASHKDGMGIGQNLATLSALSDVVSPMMYPSHYAAGEYGLKDPNSAPYQTIRAGIRDAKSVMKSDARKLRPYYQDFSLGVRYGRKEVLDQIRAGREHGVEDWILWNPLNRYSWDALSTAALSSPVTLHPAPGIKSAVESPKDSKDKQVEASAVAGDAVRETQDSKALEADSDSD